MTAPVKGTITPHNPTVTFNKEKEPKDEKRPEITQAAQALLDKSAEILSKATHAAQHKEVSDGSSADYYKLPPGRPSQLQDLISYRNMNAQMGEIFRAVYRYGVCAHSPKERELKKIIFYAKAELARIKKYGG